MPGKQNDGRGLNSAPVANQLRADDGQATAVGDAAAADYVTAAVVTA